MPLMHMQKAYSMLLDIVLLRTFVAVVEANGFTRAAGFVNLTQSAVSLHIKRLEEQVGRRLFDRTGPKLALTSDGEILLSYAQRILALEEEVKTRLGPDVEQAASVQSGDVGPDAHVDFKVDGRIAAVKLGQQRCQCSRIEIFRCPESNNTLGLGMPKPGFD